MGKKSVIKTEAPIEIVPVKYITKEFWLTIQNLFRQSYKTANKQSGSLSIPYEQDTNRKYSIAIAQQNGRMIGFIKVINFDGLFESLFEQYPEAKTINLEHPFWKQDRPAHFNRIQIEVCWVNPRFTGRGIATQLYRYAIDRMGATHIHIEENRVIDRVEYWRDLGFSKCSLYKFINSDERPSLRLHLTHDCEDLWDLNYSELCRMFYDRDLTPVFGRSRYVFKKHTI